MIRVLFCWLAVFSLASMADRESCFEFTNQTTQEVLQMKMTENQDGVCRMHQYYDDWKSPNILLKLTQRVRCIDCNQDVFETPENLIMGYIKNTVKHIVRFNGRRSDIQDPYSESGMVMSGTIIEGSGYETWFTYDYKRVSCEE